MAVTQGYVGGRKPQDIYQTEVLPAHVKAVEKQAGATRRAGGAEQAAASARARDVSRSLKGAVPGGFEDVLRGSITQKAGAALGYSGALRGAKAQQELQDPSRMAPIIKEKEKGLIALQDEISQKQTEGNAIATASTTAGGLMIAAATIAAVGSGTGPGSIVTGIVGAVIAVIGLIVGLGVSGEASSGAGEKQRQIAEQYDPSKVKEVGFETALNVAQNQRGYLGSAFTGGSGGTAGIPNYGGMAEAEEAEPWMNLTGV